MKYFRTFKFTALIAVFLTVVVGCSTTDTSGVTEQDAIDAIAAAKKANKAAKDASVEWRDTAKLIKKAEKDLADGKYADAVKKANKARRQAENALKQKQAEQNRLGLDDAPVSNGDGGDSYEVTKGDNLWDISAKSNVYSNPYHWPLIYKANSSKIKDADLIYPGQVFSIDRDASSAEASAAVNHAKSRGDWSLGAVEDTDKAFLAQ